MLLVATGHLGRACGAAKAMLPSVCLSALSWMLQRLFIQFPNWLVNTRKILLDGFDGQKLTILTCNWLVLGWDPRILKPAFGHHKHIWEFPRNLRDTLGISGSLLLEHICWLDSGSAQILILDPCFDPCIPSPSCFFISCSSHLHWPSATPTPLFGAVEGKDVPARLRTKFFPKSALPHPSQHASPETNVTFLNGVTVFKSGKKSF